MITRVILNKIIKYVIDDVYPESQCSFWSDWAIIDIISLRQVSGKFYKKKKKLYMVFVDWPRSLTLLTESHSGRCSRNLAFQTKCSMSSFDQKIKPAVLSDDPFSDFSDVFNNTKQGCVIA